jgi:hypothetical protein
MGFSLDAPGWMKRKAHSRVRRAESMNTENNNTQHGGAKFLDADVF